MNQAITVEPHLYGWVVKSTPFHNEMFFRSGENAEVAARDLGTKMSRVSDTVTIEIFLRDGSLAGSYVCAAPGWRAL
jgi:hypothetical protein